MLINGEWKVEVVNPKTPDGEFNRASTVFRDQISTKSNSKYPPEAGRYSLFVSLACPWAHRTIIFRKLKGLEDIISMYVVHPYMGKMGWSFEPGESVAPHPELEINYLKDLYLMADPRFTGRVTVPVLWDNETNMIVNNESAEIIRMLNSEFNQISGNTVDFYPQDMRDTVDKINEFIYQNINNRVYQVGFATTQLAYERNITILFRALDEIEKVLTGSSFVAGPKLTEADWRLFTTLLRFDPVYFGHFKCNLRRIEDYPNLFNYLKMLYQYPGISELCNMDHIQTHYYASQSSINPMGIVPLGPESHLSESYNR